MVHPCVSSYRTSRDASVFFLFFHVHSWRSPIGTQRGSWSELWSRATWTLVMRRCLSVPHSNLACTYAAPPLPHALTPLCWRRYRRLHPGRGHICRGRRAAAVVCPGGGSPVVLRDRHASHRRPRARRQGGRLRTTSQAAPGARCTGGLPLLLPSLGLHPLPSGDCKPQHADGFPFPPHAQLRELLYSGRALMPSFCR